MPDYEKLYFRTVERYLKECEKNDSLTTIDIETTEEVDELIKEKMEKFGVSIETIVNGSLLMYIEEQDDAKDS